MTTQRTNHWWDGGSQRLLSGAPVRWSRSGGGRSVVLVITVMTLLVMVAM
jgi:hypothetical protein